MDGVDETNDGSTDANDDWIIRLLKTRHDRGGTPTSSVSWYSYIWYKDCVESNHGLRNNTVVPESIRPAVHWEHFWMHPLVFWIQQHLVYQHLLLLLVSSFVAGDIFFVRSFVIDGSFHTIWFRCSLSLLPHSLLRHRTKNVHRSTEFDWSSLRKFIFPFRHEPWNNLTMSGTSRGLDFYCSTTEHWFFLRRIIFRIDTNSSMFNNRDTLTKVFLVLNIKLVWHFIDDLWMFRSFCLWLTKNEQNHCSWLMFQDPHKGN